MINLIPLSADDDESLYRNLWDFEPIEDSIEIGGHTLDVKETLFNAIISGRIEVTLMTDSDNKPIAYFGVTPLRLGVGEIWLSRGFGFDKNAKAAVKAGRDLGDRLLENGYFRVEMAVLPEWGKWANAIGFRFEHICEKYDGVNDHMIYTRIK